MLAPIFSIAALRKIRRTRQSGKGLAVAGLVLAGCWLLLLGVGLAAAIWGDRDGDGRTTLVGRLEVGQCFNADLKKSTLLVVDVTDCSAPHSGEAYGKVKADLAGKSSKEEELIATQECATAFDSFVGKSFKDSTLEIFYVALEDREQADGNVLCMLAGRPGQQLNGSMRGARR